MGKKHTYGPGFIAVSHRCRSGMGIYVIYILGFDARIHQGPAHTANSPVQIGIGDVMAVTAHAEAGQFSQDRGAAIYGMG